MTPTQIKAHANERASRSRDFERSALRRLRAELEADRPDPTKVAEYANAYAHHALRTDGCDDVVRALALITPN